MPADTPTDTERLAQIRTHLASVATMLGKEASLVQGHVTFLLRLLDAREAEIARHEDELAHLVAAYYRREIGRLMHQAEHWAKNNKPLAVHDRARSADNYFQIVVLMERDVSKGWKQPFDEMRDSLARPANPEHMGAYPPSAEISAYRDPRHAVAQLTAAALTAAAQSARAAALEEAARLVEQIGDPNDESDLAESISDAFNASYRLPMAERLAIWNMGIAKAIRSLIAPKEEGAEQWRHRQRGTVYEIVGTVRVQCPADAPMQDDEEPLLYRDVNSGHWGARREAEFHDGRFEKVAPPGSTDTGGEG